MKRIMIPLLVCVLLFGCRFNCRDYLNDEIKPLLIYGVVLNKYKAETPCFGYIVIQHEFKTDTVKNLCRCVVKEQKLWDYVLPGDSLYKKKDNLKVEVVRNGQIKEFDYPCCDQ